MDSDTRRPVPGLPMVYRALGGFGLVTRRSLASPAYVSDREGRAFVPSGVMLEPGDASSRANAYVLDGRRDIGKPVEEIAANKIIYVRRFENYVRWLGRELKRSPPLLNANEAHAAQTRYR
jgi:hypothetical protein